VNWVTRAGEAEEAHYEKFNDCSIMCSRITDTTIVKVDVVSPEVDVSKGLIFGRGHSQRCSHLICNVGMSTLLVPYPNNIALGGVPVGGGRRV
jgi:hypothetical protein